jgi:hypothetical protein
LLMPEGQSLQGLEDFRFQPDRQPRLSHR